MILRSYSQYREFMRDTGHSINATIEKHAENIKNDRFVLMVAGEAKSGKSTFINAFLGREILPMDVKQCTSAIIEIYYSDSFELIAEYANGRREVIDSQDGITDFLKNHASLNDIYRKIPVTTINNELLIKCKGIIHKQYVHDFLDGVQGDNLYNLPKQEYNKLITDYIFQEKDNWGNIVTKIRVGYPFAEEMKGITIIDSPGVNAEGKVGDITEKYIENANAIIFIKSLTGQALESSSFKKFLESKSLDKHKETMFLMLTGAANHTNEEVYKLNKQASEMYTQVSEDKILTVDSKAQLFLNNCRQIPTSQLGQYFLDLYSKGQSFATATECWFMSQGDFKKFEELMERKSNFTKIHHVLEKFARSAQYLALLELIELLQKVYIKTKDTLEEKIMLNKVKLKDPKDLEYQISKKLEEIDNIKRKLSSTIANIRDKYTDFQNGIIKNESERAIESFKASLSKLSSQNIEQLQKKTFQKIEDLIEFRNDLGKKLIEECNLELMNLTSNKDLITFTFLEPEFSKEDFEIIKRETERNANKIEYIEEGICFKKSREVPRYSLDKHYNLIKNDIFDRLEVLNSQVISNLIDYTIETTKVYQTKLRENADEKQKDYEKLLNDKKTAEETLQQIDKDNEFIEEITSKLMKLDQIKGGISSNVKY
jgi:hypothetical protein